MSDVASSSEEEAPQEPVKEEPKKRVPNTKLNHLGGARPPTHPPMHAPH